MDLLPLGHVNELLEFLHARKAKYGSSMHLAEMMGVTFSGLLRGMKTGTLSIENCLRLADVLGEDPVIVLRAARKNDAAEQIARIYGKAVDVLSAEEREVVERWRAMTARSRDSLRVIIRELAPKEREKPKRKTA